MGRDVCECYENVFNVNRDGSMSISFWFELKENLFSDAIY